MKATVAILAGGLATRLRPVTESIPKSLVPIKGKPFIEYQLKLLAGSGMSEALICTGYRGDLIEAHVGDGSRFGLNVSYSHDGDVLLGTGGALKKALPQLGERFVVIYGDSYLVEDYCAPVSYFDERRAHSDPAPPGLMTVFRNSGRYDRSNVVFRDGRIAVYDKQRTYEDMHHIDWGLGVLHADAFAPFRETDIFDLAELYGVWVQKGLLLGYEVERRFYEVGSLQGIADFEEFLARSVAER